MAATAPIAVTFDHPVDRTSVAHRFHVDPPLSGCTNLAAAFVAPASAPCHVVWNRDSSSFSLVHPGALLVPLQHYTVSLDAGVTDTGGVVNSLDHHWAFTAAPAPTVLSVSPGSGTADTPVDAPVVVTFSTTMDPATTAAAIQLSPAVEGTRVLANDRDHSRFVVLPGRLLQPGAHYTVSVAAGATDDRGEPLGAAAASDFTTGALSGAGHAVVLAADGPGEPPSAVILTGLGPAQTGDPVPSLTVLAAPRCAAAVCGGVGRGGALVAYLAAAGSPDGSTIAVVEHDAAAAADQRSLHVIDLPAGTDTLLTDGGDLPAWSPDGHELAYSGRGGVHVLHRGSGVDQQLPGGDPLAAAPVWSGDGSVLALPVSDREGYLHVDLASPRVDARYPLPSVGGTNVSVSAPALNPDGTEVAIRQDGTTPVAGTWLVGLRTADASPRRLGATLVPIAYIAAATLVAVERPGDGPAVLVRVSTATGDVARIPEGSGGGVDLSRVAVDRVRHQIGFLVDDADGVVQAAVENADGSNPVRLTTLRPADGLVAVSVSFGG